MNPKQFTRSNILYELYPLIEFLHKKGYFVKEGAVFAQMVENKEFEEIYGRYKDLVLFEDILNYYIEVEDYLMCADIKRFMDRKKAEAKASER